jgi:hypothetical protein
MSRPGFDRGDPKLKKLFTQAEFLDDGFVAVIGSLFEIVQKTPAPGDHHQKAAARGMILRVGLKMVGELIDSFSEDRYLHIRAAGILIVQAQTFECFVTCHGVVLWEAEYANQK